MLKNVNEQSAMGGGDLKVTAALFEGVCQEWRDDAAKLIIFLADAGPHGMGEGNEQPDGDPDGKDPLALAREAESLEICSLLVKPPWSATSDKTKWFFAALSAMTGGQTLDLASASHLGDSILAGARENPDLEKSVRDVRDHIAELEKKNGGKLTKAERAKATAGVLGKGGGTKPRALPSDHGLQVPAERIQQAMSVQTLAELRKLWDGSAEKIGSFPIGSGRRFNRNVGGGPHRAHVGGARRTFHRQGHHRVLRGGQEDPGPGDLRGVRRQQERSVSKSDP